MQALAKRHIKSGKPFEQYFSKARFATINLPESDVYTTLEYMKNLVQQVNHQTQPMAALAKSTNLNQTCANLFKFIYEHVQYKPDQKGVEQLRTPNRTWADRKTGVDCDCYSIIISSLLTNMSIPHAFRMTKYDGKPNYQHVYVIVPKNGKTISHRNSYYVIDPVLDHYNHEKKYSQKHDKMMKIPHQILNGTHDVLSNNYPFGQEFEHLNGLGNAQDQFLSATHNHLKNTLAQVQQNPNAFSTVVEPSVFKAQLTYVLENWHDPIAREGALEEMAEMEELGEHESENVLEEESGLGYASPFHWRRRKAKLSIKGSHHKINHLRHRRAQQKRVVPATIQRGTLKTDSKFKAQCSCHMIGGLEGYFNGLGIFRRKNKSKGGFFKKVWSGIKNTSKKVGTAAKKVGKAIVRFNPVTIAARNGLLLAMRSNLFGLAQKLKYGYLQEYQAKAKHMNIQEWRKLKATIANLNQLFATVGGKPENLRNAILKGKAGGLNGLGEPATAATTAAASGLIVKIAAWLKNIDFKKLFQTTTKVANTASQIKQTLQPGGTHPFQADPRFTKRPLPLYTQADYQKHNPNTSSIPTHDLPEFTVEAKRQSPQDTKKTNVGTILALAAAGLAATTLLKQGRGTKSQKKKPKASLNGVVESVAI